MDARSIIVRPVISERSYDMIEQNRYTFEVAKTASKIEIADAVEEIFKVSVTKVNTMNVSGKEKRVRYAKGFTRDWKKAIVTLKQGDTIDFNV